MKNLFFFSFLIVFSTLLSSCNGENFDDFLEDNTECSDFCDNAEFSPLFQNNGDCMSLCNTCNNPSNSNATTAVCVCNWYESYLGLLGLDWGDLGEESGFKNKGQCVKTIKASLAAN